MYEILSPAGNMETLTSAVQNGADAVYLGMSDFSARAGADNFDKNTLPQALDLCHSAGVKVYVTLNTLIKDSEIPQMREMIVYLAQNGVDGVIVQDMATALLVRKTAPEMPLHASTQMCIYSLEGARALEKLGFCRVVLARELSLEEITHIAKNTHLEIEVFVHGALCMCYSGHCYFSAVVGRNSGNRGRCAQPCRLPYQNGYPLSLKDLCLIDHMDALKKAGVTSFKIEGRLKSAAYVAGVTAAFADALRGNAPSEQTMTHLKDLFSRDGFTDGYLQNKTGPDMFGTKQKTEYADYKAALNAQNQRKPFKRFDLNVTLSARVGQRALWQFDDGENSVTVEGQVLSPAQNKALDHPSLQERLDKLSDTHYRLGKVTLSGDDNVFLPVSAINEARRAGCTLLDEKRNKPNAYPVCLEEIPLAPAYHHTGKTQVLYHSMGAFDPATDHTACSAVWLPARQAHLYKGAGGGAHIDHFLPEHALPSLIEQLKQNGIKRVLVGNIGHIEPFLKQGFEVWGDYGLNITNSYALAEYQKLGLHNACLSFELRLSQIQNMHLCMPTTVIAYGRLPLMQFKNCVIRQTDCLKQNGFSTLTDRKGHTFLLSCKEGCGNILFNSLPLYLDGEMPRHDKRFDFTDETPARVRQILSGTRPEGELTNGLYHRGVI